MSPLPNEVTPRWYVVHTYSGYENRVASDIAKIVENRGLGDSILAVRVPTQTSIEITDKGPKEIKRKVFQSYVFVKMVMNDTTWHIIRYTHGVTGFVGPGSMPVPLSEEDVRRHNVEEPVIDIKFVVGDSVKINDGVLIGHTGVVQSISPDSQKVTVIASMFGRETEVELDVTQVLPLEDA